MQEAAQLIGSQTRGRGTSGGHHLPMVAVIFALVLLTSLLVVRLALGTFEVFVRDAEKSPDPAPVSITVGAVPLAVPGNMIRYAADRGGDLAKVDLFADWRNGEGYSLERAALFQPGAAGTPVVYFALRPTEGSMSPEFRFRSVYPRVLAEDSRTEAGGIMVRGFKRGYGYDGEELYIARDPERPLAARCLIDESEEASACLSEFRTADGRLDVSYRFRRDQVAEWREIDAALRRLVAGFAR